MSASAPRLDPGSSDELRQATDDLCRRSFADYVQLGWSVTEPITPLDWWWHHDALCLHLQVAFCDWMAHRQDESAEQRIQNLLANVPPGTLKSRLVSVYFPTWAWLLCPEWRVICLSSNPGVALRDAVLSRQVLESPWYQQTFRPRWRLRDDQDAKGLYANTRGGFRMSKGWGARIVGDRGDAIIGDDPNDMTEIHSETVREGVNADWDTAIANRVNDLRTSIRIVIQQRGHERDFSGHVIAKGDMKWARLVIPMEYEPENAVPWAVGAGDPRLVAGEVLQPRRFTPAVLEVERKRGSYYYAGQFQQRPAPAGGGMFKRAHWRFWKPDGTQAGDAPRPTGCYGGPARAIPRQAMADLVISLDAAFKGTITADPVAFTVWGRHGADRYLVDRVCGQMTFGQTKTALRMLALKWPQARRKLVEDKANGTAIMDDLHAEMAGLIAVEPQGGKEARAHAVQPQVESGNVFLPDGAPWLGDFIGEFDAFPVGAHDDQVDSSTQALIYLADPSMRAAEGMASW